MKKILFILLLFSQALRAQYVITTIGGNGYMAGWGHGGFSGDGGPATAAELSTPFGIAIDNSGNVYFSDLLNQRIRKINNSGIITTIAGNGTAGYSGDGGPATDAKLCLDTIVHAGIAVDRFGNIFIADGNNYRVRMVDTSGTIWTAAGTGGYGFSGDGGPATAAALRRPCGVAVDRTGNLFIADQDDYRIRKVNASGVISTVAGNGSYGYSGDGGTATNAKLSGPFGGICVGVAGNLYIADVQNERIRIVDPSGIINTFAGNGYGAGGSYGGYSGDGGAATDAELNSPRYVAADLAGNVYIADMFNHRIRKVTTGGSITTLAGDGTPAYNGDGGPATIAELNNPMGVAVDSAGNVYIADSWNNVIRKLSPGQVRGGTSVCIGSMLTLTDTISGGRWSSSNSLVASVSGSGVVTGINAGTAIISYAVAGITSMDTITVSTTIPPRPIIGGRDSICPGDTVTLTTTSAGGRWLSLRTSVMTITGSGLVTGIHPGIDTILFIATNGCGSDTGSYLLYPRAGCPDGIVLIPSVQAGMDIFPNPNDGIFTLRITAAKSDEVVVAITNVIGEKVKELRNVPNRDIRLQMNVSPGVYYISATIDSERIVKKVLVE